MRQIESIKKRLGSEIRDSSNCGNDKNKVDFDTQCGVLISRNDAEFILKILEGEK